MKSLLRHYVITLFSLWATDQIIPGITFTGSIQLFALAALILMGMNIFIKPIFKIILLPITLLTMGLSLVFVNAVIFYVLDRFIEELSVTPWHFAGLMIAGYSIPALQFGIIATYAIGAFILSALISFLRWL